MTETNKKQEMGKKNKEFQDLSQALKGIVFKLLLYHMCIYFPTHPEVTDSQLWVEKVISQAYKDTYEQTPRIDYLFLTFRVRK